MFSKVINNRAQLKYKKNKHLFFAKTLNHLSHYDISKYAYDAFTDEWNKPEKKAIAKAITLRIIITANYHQNHQSNKPFPRGKVQHHSIILAHGKTYGKPCLVDHVHAPSVEHVLEKRVAIAITRNPNPRTLETCQIIASEVGRLLLKLDEKTIKSIFEIGTDIKETRSKDFLRHTEQLIDNLINNKTTPPQKLLRALEFVLSPLGMFANAYEGPFCKIKQEKQKGKDVSGLEDLMKGIMPYLKPFHVPYIKGKGAPYGHLQTQSDTLSIVEHEYNSSPQYLGCIDPLNHNEVRSVKIKDETGETIVLHDYYNQAHFFNVSGTTGAVLQAALGFLSMASKLDYVNTIEDINKLGMILAGCNFHKQGFHTFIETLPAINWVNYIIYQKHYRMLTPLERIHETANLLKKCIDQNSEIANLVCETIELNTEHALIHNKCRQEKSLPEKDVGFVCPSGKAV